MTIKNRANNFGQLKLFCEKNGYELDTDLVYGRYGDNNISVTELLSIIKDPSFEYVKANHSKAVEEACERWTAIHDMLESEHVVQWCRSTKIDTTKTSYYKRFREWKLLYGIEILEKEKTYYKDWIRGTVDAVTNLGIVDYKTSKRQNEKYKIQIAAYCWLSWLNDWRILYMDDKGFIFVEVHDLKYYTDIWLELLEYKETIILFNKNKDG